MFRSRVPFRSIPVCWFVSSFIGLVHIVSLVSVYFVVYYESIKRELKIRLMNEGRYMVANHVKVLS